MYSIAESVVPFVVWFFFLFILPFFCFIVVGFLFCLGLFLLPL